MTELSPFPVTERAPYRFETRGMESLSNTVFGLAMTLPASDRPRSVQFSGAPSWAEPYNLYAARLMAVV